MADERSITVDGVNFNADWAAKHTKTKFIDEHFTTRFQHLNEKDRKALLGEAWEKCQPAKAAVATGDEK
jgi:hypothetical protein